MRIGGVVLAKRCSVMGKRMAGAKGGVLAGGQVSSFEVEEWGYVGGGLGVASPSPGI